MAGLDDLLAELFAPIGGVSIRRMFGGQGIFKEGVMFGLVSGDVLYLKADDETKAPYEAEGFARWVYPGMKGAVAMPYWQVPDRLFDEPDEFTNWARKAFAVAVAGRDAKGKPKAKKPGKQDTTAPSKAKTAPGRKSPRKEKLAKKRPAKARG